MAEGTLDEEAAGAAIAAFALAQMMFWQLLQKGVIEKAEALEMLERTVEVNGGRDRPHKIAAAKLAKLLHCVEAYRTPEHTTRREPSSRKVARRNQMAT